MTVRFILISLCIIIFPFSAGAQSKDPSQLQTLQVFFENDLFGKTDKYYTNAVQLTWLSNDLKQYKDDVRLPDWTFPVIRAIPFSQTPGSIHNVGILLGQHIYTPSDIQATSLQSNDRPYAGFLYGGLALHSKTDLILDTLEIVVGIVGPYAYAEFAQNTVHEMRDIPTAKGWDNQLHNEPAVRFSWQRKWRIYRDQAFNTFDYDLIGHSGITLGNVRIAGTIGGEIRFGYHLPSDFGSDTIRAGAGVSTPALNRPATGRRPFGIHLFAGSQLEVVVHDIFLDGNTFKNSPSVKKEKLVGDLSAGLALNFDRYKFTYRHVYRTKQFAGQKQDQIIGSLTMTVSF
ncbi:MAG: lipid A deacylase LpxR family protein [Desulfobacterales bacterium]|nr:lipid A deacylase LpxR family protein [Desulfobacterales bacterium]